MYDPVKHAVGFAVDEGPLQFAPQAPGFDPLADDVCFMVVVRDEGDALTLLE